MATIMQPTVGRSASDDVVRPVREGRRALPRVWAILEDRKGDDGQLLHLAHALGWPCEFKKPLYTLPEVLQHRITGITRRSNGRLEVLEPPWPDLILTIGGRSVVAARRIRERSGGRTRVVCLGRPWAPLHWFDLVVTTPQYQLPDRPNVLHNTLPLNQPPAPTGDAADQRRQQTIRELPGPRIGVLVGGSNGIYVLDAAAAVDLARRASDLARRLGGSLLVATSPRTAASAADALAEALEGPHTCYLWHRQTGRDNPYGLFLDRADSFVVTSDSASLLADACAMGKPTWLYALPQSRRARLLGMLSSAGGDRSSGSRPSAHWRDPLVARGLWVPRRDLSRIHGRLFADGRLAPLGQSTSQSAPDGDLQATVRRIHRLLAWEPQPARSLAVGVAG